MGTKDMLGCDPKTQSAPDAVLHLSSYCWELMRETLMCPFGRQKPSRNAYCNMQLVSSNLPFKGTGLVIMGGGGAYPN